MSAERDRCAIEAMRLALKHLGPALSVCDSAGMRLTPKGQDIEYIRMTLDLYQDVLDERGEWMIKTPYSE